MMAAVDHREKVMLVFEQAADAARAQLGAVCGLSEMASTAIMEMQVRHFAQLERSKIHQDREQQVALEDDH